MSAMNIAPSPQRWPMPARADRSVFATVTCGPGLTQLMTALPAAVAAERAGIPLVVIAGDADDPCPLTSAWVQSGD